MVNKTLKKKDGKIEYASQSAAGIYLYLLLKNATPEERGI
jgi:hypothetical protein